MANTNTNTPGTVFHGLLSAFATDIVQAGGGLVANFFKAIAANPTQENVIAQATMLAVAAPLVLPTLQTEAISQFAAAGQALVAMIPTKVTV